VGSGWKRAVAAAAIVAAIGWAESGLPDEPADATEVAFVPEPGFAKLAALGFDAVLADYYWLRAVQVVGAAEHPEGHSELIGRLIDVVTTLDPWVLHPYRFAALWMTDDEQAVRKADTLLERGIEHHPQDWLNRFHLGFNHFFYFGENAEAAAALEPAVNLPGAPRYLGRLVARLRSDAAGGQLEAASAFLNELLRQNTDPYRKAEYEKALDEIETERRARILDAARTEFQHRHRRDITSVEELVQVAPPVLRELPPEPHGWEWKLDTDSGQILSTWVGHRYSVLVDGTNRSMLDRFHERSRQRQQEEGS